MTFTSDGKFLLTAEADKEAQEYGVPNPVIRMWNTATGQQARTLRPDSGRSGILTLSGDDRFLAVQSSSSVVVLELSGGRSVFHFDRESRFVDLSEARWAPDNRTILVQVGPLLRLWNIATGKELLPLREPKAMVQCVRLSSDGKWLAIGCVDGTVGLWDVASKQPCRKFHLKADPRRNVVFASDRRTLASFGTDDLVLAFLDLSSGQVCETTHLVPLFPAEFGFVTLVPQSRYFAEAMVRSQSIYLRQWPDGRLIKSWQIPGYINAIDASPDGSMLAVASTSVLASEGERVDVLEISTGRQLLSVRADARDGMKFSYDGRYLICGMPGGMALWEVLSAQRVARFDAKSIQQVCRAGTLSCNGRWLILSESQSLACQLWDGGRNEQLAQIRVDGRRVEYTDLSLRGQWLATSLDDGSVVLWDVFVLSGMPARASTNTGAALADQWWSRLAEKNAADAFAAVQSLSACGPTAVGLLKQKLNAVSSPDRERTRQLIGALEDAQYARRAEAHERLDKMGRVIEPFLREALLAKPSFEARRRLESLLQAIQATPYTSLAKGAPGARETQDAKAALQRLAVQAN